MDLVIWPSGMFSRQARLGAQPNVLWAPCSAWTPNYCMANEPGTLGYDVAIADNNPLKVLVYERCVFGVVTRH